jgi:MFS family permease
MNNGNMRLFIACFIALIATSFGFIIRALTMDTWAAEFGFSETQKGEIFGVGLWPFAISIVLFSLIIDKIGYGKAMLFAFICHMASIAITIYAYKFKPAAGAVGADADAMRNSAYWTLYFANFIVALANGTVEAVINPVVATMFSRDKTKWLNILHAGWPGGLVLAGLLVIGMTTYFKDLSIIPGAPTWATRVAILAIPVLLYGLLMLGCKFPVNERVAAGVSFRDMLKEVGFLGALVVTSLIVFEVTRVLEGMDFVKLFADKTWSEIIYKLNLGGFELAIEKKLAVKLGIILGVSLLFGLWVLSLGRFMFFFLMLIMIPLAITELGTDSWITSLMEPEMAALGVSMGLGKLDPAWVLIYTSLIMMILRLFFAGPIVHKLTPLGLLAVSALIAAVGLMALSLSTGLMILLAATLYGFGKTFFWPTMLGVVAEQFPKGGALTLNTMGGVGMLGVGVLGGALLGNIQDQTIDSKLKKEHAPLHAKVMDAPKTSLFGPYQPVDNKKLETVSADEKKTVKDIQDGAKKSALFSTSDISVVVFPIFMLICYLILILYFKGRGGYKAELLPTGQPAGLH